MSLSLTGIRFPSWIYLSQEMSSGTEYLTVLIPSSRTSSRRASHSSISGIMGSSVLQGFDTRFERVLNELQGLQIRFVRNELRNIHPGQGWLFFGSRHKSPPYRTRRLTNFELAVISN